MVVTLEKVQFFISSPRLLSMRMAPPPCHHTHERLWRSQHHTWVYLDSPGFRRIRLATISGCPYWLLFLNWRGFAWIRQDLRGFARIGLDLPA